MKPKLRTLNAVSPTLALRRRRSFSKGRCKKKLKMNFYVRKDFALYPKMIFQIVISKPIYYILVIYLDKSGVQSNMGKQEVV